MNINISGDMFLATVQAITGAKTFADGTLKLAGSSSGAATLKAPAAAGSIVVTLPGVTDTLAVLGANTFTAAQTLASGSAGSPALVVAGTNTGFYSSSTNRLTVSVGGTAQFEFSTGGLLAKQAAHIGWAALAVDGTPLTAITSPSAAIIQHGAANSATPVAQTLQAQGSRSGTDSNVGGANLTIQSGLGTGTGTLSTLNFASPVAVASGTGAQTMTTAMTVYNGKVGIGTASPSSVLHVVAGASVSELLNVTGDGSVDVSIYLTSGISSKKTNLYFGTSGSRWRWIASETGVFELRSNSVSAIISATQAGNVGIGIIAPTATLDIADMVLAGSGSLAGSILNLAQTWNTSGTPTAIKLNVTNTASNAASLLADFKVGGVSKSYIRRDGLITAAGGFYCLANNTGFDTLSGGYFAINSIARLTAPSAATWQLGAADSASPIAQTLTFQGSRAGTDSNVAGPNATIQGATGTGNATPSALIIKTPTAVASGTGTQTQTEVARFDVPNGLTIASGLALKLGNAATTGLTAGVLAALTNASVTLVDSSGQTYRIPCII